MVEGPEEGGASPLPSAQRQRAIQMQFGRASSGNWLLSSSLLSTKVQWNPNLKRLESKKEWKNVSVRALC